MRVLLTSRGWTSGGIPADSPEAVYGLVHFVFAAWQELFVDTLGNQLLAELFLVSVLMVGHWLAFVLCFAEAGGITSVSSFFFEQETTSVASTTVAHTK